MSPADRANNTLPSPTGEGLCSLLQAALESTDDGLLLVDRDGKFIDFNQKFVQMWHLPGAGADFRSHTQTLAFVLDQLISPQEFLDRINEVYSHPEAASRDVLKFKDGRVIERLSQPMRVNGQTAGRLWSFRDVSARWRAEEAQEQSQRKYQELMDSLDGIVWECKTENGALRFTLVSRQAERLLGYPVSRWLTEPTFWVDIMHPEDRAWAPAFCAEQTALLKGHEFEYRLIAADGRVVWVRDLVSVVVTDGRPVGIRGVMVDVTDRRRAEEQRDRLLQQEQVQRSAAEEAVRARDEFLSIASHELRTPVTSLQLAVQGLLRLLRRDQLASAPPELLANALGVAERQSKRLHRLIDSLLDVSLIQAGRLELEPALVDLAALARQVVRNFSEDLEAAGCTLTLTAETPVLGNWDANRIEQVISNLLANAIKYGPGKAVALRVEAGKDAAQLVVQDHGIGIAQERQGRIFERFERGVSAQHYGGLGLGLYIARLLVQAHGGSIEVESQLAAGAAFTVKLPYDQRS